MIDSESDVVVWRNVPSRPDLSANDIHIWRASLDLNADTLRRLQEALAPDERARASRFAFPRDRDHFTAARGILRELLGQYLNQAPAAVTFDYGPRAKPALRAVDSGSLLRFNLSHSHGLALYAFTRGHDVGIDLELIRPNFGGEELARRYLSKRELAELLALPPELRPTGFFVCWTQKEAYVKALGEGLQIPLDSFDVSLTSENLGKLRSADGRRWRLLSFRPAQRFVAAVASEAGSGQLRYLRWTP
jgi:4'-phosphopantetheinyl transferase